MSDYSPSSQPRYQYTLPEEEDKVKTDAILMAYLTFAMDYPTPQQNKGILDEEAFSLCQRLKKCNSTQLTNEYTSFCQIFLSYFTATYEILGESCAEDGGQVIRKLKQLLVLTSPSICVNILRNFIHKSVYRQS